MLGAVNSKATTALRILSSLYLSALVSMAFGQLASGTDPTTVADEAVEAWLSQEPVTVERFQHLSAAEVCLALPALIQNPPPRVGTEVNLTDRRSLDTGDPNRLQFTYSATLPRERLEVVQVTLVRGRDGETWLATEVGYWVDRPTGRPWLQGRVATVLFVIFSLMVLYLVLTRSFFRAWLVRGLEVARGHRRLVVGTLIGLYSLFALGALVGSQLPDECGDAVLALVSTAIDAVGATDAYGSGNVATAATVTFYQNFVVVTVFVTGTLALLFGIPAYLLSAVSFFFQAIPFGLLGAFSGPNFPFFLVLILLELTAYFLVVAGGGILLVTLIRKGFGARSEAIRNLFLMFPLAMLLLLVGAWYEALILIQFGI